MAITQATIIDEANATNASSYVFPAAGSITPVANRLYLLGITFSGTSLRTATISTTTGLVFQLVTEITYDTVAAPTNRLAVYRAMRSSGLGAGTITVTTSGAVSHCVCALHEFDGVNTGGTDGSSAVVQSATARGDSGSSYAVTLAAFGGTDNASFLAVSTADDVNITAEAGHTELTNTSPGTEAIALYTQWRNPHGSDTTPSATCATAENWGAVALEIAAAAAGGTTYTQSVGGTITPTGALARRTGKLLAGALTPSGGLTRRVARSLLGSLTPTGDLVSTKVSLLSLVGAITPTGSLARRTGKLVAGAITPVGTAAKRVAQLVAGAITPSGALSASLEVPPETPVLLRIRRWMSVMRRYGRLR